MNQNIYDFFRQSLKNYLLKLSRGSFIRKKIKKS